MQFKEQLNITNPFINFKKDNKIEVTIDNVNNNKSAPIKVLELWSGGVMLE
jgi:hypothetical protein